MSDSRPDPDADQPPSPSRRLAFKSLALIPVVAAGACQRPSGQAAQQTGAAASATAAASGNASTYRPTFFNATEWACVQAACDQLIPHDAHGPGALELGVPEFLDRHMQSPYAAGDIWYMQGPFLDAPANFGYQGRLALRDILRVGLAALDAHCRRTHNGKTFAALAPAERDAVLKGAEAGSLKWPEISDKQFFAQLLTEVRNGYFADPMHGGNKNMGSWKMIGYPGVRADYLDWVGVRDRPYPIPPVDLAGRRG